MPPPSQLHSLISSSDNTMIWNASSNAMKDYTGLFNNRHRPTEPGTRPGATSSRTYQLLTYLDSFWPEDNWIQYFRARNKRREDPPLTGDFYKQLLHCFKPKIAADRWMVLECGRRKLSKGTAAWIFVWFSLSLASSWTLSSSSLWSHCLYKTAVRQP